jgi:hypothetical protein
MQVVVLEKGRFTPAAELPLRERESFEEMYEMGSFMTTQDAGERTSSLYTANQCWGTHCSTSVLPERPHAACPQANAVQGQTCTCLVKSQLDSNKLRAAGVNILAGSTLGGGTRVNWQASFETPAHVRREWAQEHGLPAIASEQYDRALQAVCTRLGVTTGDHQFTLA